MQKSLGLTLIEVLIALAIVGIALTAVIKATSQNIRATDYLQTKTMAMWAGQSVLNEIRLDVIKLPTAADQVKKSITLLDREWYVEAKKESTPNKNIKKITVIVYTHPPENEDITPIISLESYQLIQSVEGS